MRSPAVIEAAFESEQILDGNKSPKLLILSAGSEDRLEDASHHLREYLSSADTTALEDVAHSLQIGSAALSCRRMLVCASREDAIDALTVCDPKRVLSARRDDSPPRIVLLLPGVGDQYVGMAHGLYMTWEVFRREVDHVAQLFLNHLGTDIKAILYPPHLRWKTADRSNGVDLRRMLGRNANHRDDPDTANLNRTIFAHPTLFAIEYAMAQLWRSLGIVPTAIVGHSLGEYVAACLAGVLSLTDAVRLVAIRAQLAESQPQAAMLSVMLTEEKLRSLLDQNLEICLINGPAHCVVAGPADAVAELEQRLAVCDVISRRVQNSHGFHSRLMNPVADAFRVEVSQIQLKAPSIPYISNVTGDWITAAQATDPTYWVQHLTRPARFSDAFQQLGRLPDPTLLEAGPGRTLSVLAGQHPQRPGPSGRRILSSLRHGYETADDQHILLSTIGKLWLAGGAIRWEAFPDAASRTVIPVLSVLRSDAEPRQQRDDGDADTVRRAATASARCSSADRMVAGGTVGYLAPRNDLELSLTRACERVFGLPRVGITDNFFELGAQSLTIIRLLVEMKQTTGLDIDLGEVFRSPTVEALVEHIGPNAKRNAAIVVPLRSEGKRTAIFCICGIDIYKEFAQHLGEDQPAFGVYVDEERGIINEALSGKIAAVSINRLVDAYHDAIVRFRPEGPYRLAGVSFGGLLATALACKLRKRGATVDVVFLFDTLLPEGRQRIWSRWLFRRLAALRSEWHRKYLPHLYAKLRHALSRPSGMTPDDYLSDSAGSRAPEAAAFNRQFVQRQRAAFSAAYEQWTRSQSIIDFPLVLFRATLRDVWPTDIDIAEDYGWRRYAGDHLSVVDVPGGHTSMLAIPNVGEVARQAQRHLE